MNALRQRPDWSEAIVHPVRTFHTVRHLRPKQLVYRAIRSLQPVGAELAIDETLFLLARRPSPAAESCQAFDGRGFSFLNRRIAWDGANRWWPDGADDLWLFNLHYFRFLASVDPAVGSDLVSDWLTANVDRRATAWHPYPISLRVREWIEWLLEHQDLDPTLRARAIRSIAEQTESLRRRLEFGLMGNHLLENAITLCWAGLSFAGRRADAWLEEGAQVLVRELRSQLLHDGMHQERSPMYQALLVEAILRLAEVAAQSAKSSARRIHRVATVASRRMIRALQQLVHPDGEYALVNDTALHMAPTYAALRARFGISGAAADRSELWTLDGAAYAGFRDTRGGYLVFDGGPIGPDHQVGHGHADTLSFELSAQGRRVLTDTGVYTYATGAARQHDRSTAAHNTITIDDRDQSELWGAFRCARRVETDPIGAGPTRDGAALVGAYRGPGVRGGVGHQRSIARQGSVLAFTDTVTAPGRHDATLRLHFAPGIELRRTTAGWSFGDRGRPPLGVLTSSLAWSASTSPYHPEFGREIERASLSAPIAFRNRTVARWWLLLR